MTAYPKYEVVVGLEIHAQLKTKSKLFCGCSTTFGGTPNSNVCPVCTGQPGVLPVLNQTVVLYALKTALAVDCEKIRQGSIFARKNYFYPDLPKDYQVSQYEEPLAEKGVLEIAVTLPGGSKGTKKIGITRIHLEEDAGKLVHAGADRIHGSTHSYVDFNRTGIPLMEIVSEPDMRTPEEAKTYVQDLRAILVSIGVCDGNLEEGSLRCDANISLRPWGQQAFGTKVEVKNMNSYRTIQKALEAEIVRQTEALDNGEKIYQETRHYDEDTNTTISLRSKEEAHDYRYFPEPDLLPIEITDAMMKEAKETLGELPAQKHARLIQDYQLTAAEAEILTSDAVFSAFFEAATKLGAKPKTAANWLLGDVRAYLNKEKLELTAAKISPEKLVALIKLVDSGTISHTAGKEVIIKMLESGDSAESIVKASGATQISDESAIEEIIKQVLAANPNPVADFKAGKAAAMGFLTGQAMKASKGRANPGKVNEILKKLLGN